MIDDFTVDPEFTYALDFDPERLNEQKAKARQFFLPATGISAFDDHYGFRPGCLHNLLGSSGKGKSTLMLSVLLEICKKAVALVYLSEESLGGYELKLFEMDDDPVYLSPKLHVFAEKDLLKTIDPFDYVKFLSHIEAKIISSNAKIFICDNITTSQFYQFRNTQPILNGLKMLAEKYNIAVFLVSHTKKGVSESVKGIFLPDDVRGSAQLGMLPDYFYSFTRVHYSTVSGTKINTAIIYINKCRHHDTQDNIYALDYDIEKKRYVKSKQITFEVFKEIMKQRDK